MKKHLKIAGLQILFAMCIVMHLAAMLPHHHHDGSEVPCISLHLCFDGGCCCSSDCTVDDHRHDQPVTGICNAHSITITQPERSQTEISPAAVEVPDYLNGIASLAEALRSADFSVEVSFREYRHGPDSAPLPLRRICSASLSPRAPDFKA